MKYIVLHDRKPLPGISIEPAGRTYQYPIKCWAMNDGRRVLFAHSKMGKLLEKFHMGGNYEHMAMYGLSYDELCHIVRDAIGPSDDERFYAASLQVQRQVERTADAHRTSRMRKADNTVLIVTSVLFTVVATAALVILLGVKFLATMALLPLAVAFFKR